MTVSMAKAIETARPRSRLSRMVLRYVTSHTSYEAAQTLRVSRCNKVHTELNEAE